MICLSDNSGRGRSKRRARASFTLAELMIVISIIAILASSVMFAMFGIIEDAKAARTRAQIVKLHSLVVTRWEQYQWRAVPLQLPSGTPPRVAAQQRLYALRDLMRMEMPDRVTDVYDSPVILAAPSLWKGYRRRATSATGTTTWYPPSSGPHWSLSFQGAECLYLIIGSIHEGDASALEFFRDGEVGDTDGDGMLEILDAWGNPIEFLRWAPGFATLPGPDGFFGVAGVDDDGNGITDDILELGWPGSDDESEIQSRDPAVSPDPFDPLKVDPKWLAGSPPSAPLVLKPYALYPLIYSAGPDGKYDIASEDSSNAIHYRSPPSAHSSFSPNLASDPYLTYAISPSGNPVQLGLPTDPNASGDYGFLDNISNHLLTEN